MEQKTHPSSSHDIVAFHMVPFLISKFSGGFELTGIYDMGKMLTNTCDHVIISANLVHK
ncbi:hypothetical protein KIN20_019154 [Parelaphostrongylus tenuis]|uniref:Uncharacterized protein n=1 Tax=Parelaphostrongylus tenuis TaxID=148309 RepID=A0AAD5MR55_PARTN|nr:hypothetical protein KIN20_019154 [Parelaphostrongylus tenuis]